MGTRIGRVQSGLQALNNNQRPDLGRFCGRDTYPEDPGEEVAPSNLPPELQPVIPTWVLYVDRSSNKQGSGAGIILTTPEGIQLEYTLRFGFQAFNNKAKYEALLVELQLVTSWALN